MKAGDVITSVDGSRSNDAGDCDGSCAPTRDQSTEVMARRHTRPQGAVSESAARRAGEARGQAPGADGLSADRREMGAGGTRRTHGSRTPGRPRRGRARSLRLSRACRAGFRVALPRVRASARADSLASRPCLTSARITPTQPPAPRMGTTIAPGTSVGPPPPASPRAERCGRGVVGASGDGWQARQRLWREPVRQRRPQVLAVGIGDPHDEPGRIEQSRRTLEQGGHLLGVDEPREVGAQVGRRAQLRRLAPVDLRKRGTGFRK